MSPVGRITCSTKTPSVRASSQGPGRRRDEHRRRPHLVPLLELQGPVVDAGGQAEAVLGERGFALVVAEVHAADLGYGDVALVHDEERVLGQILEKRRRRLAGAASGQVARVVFDAGAGAGRLDHLEIEGGALLEPLRLQELARLVELLQVQLQILADEPRRLLQRGLGRHVVAVGVDLDRLQGSCLGAGQGIELDDALDLVAEEGDAPAPVLEVRGEELDHVAAHAEGAAVEVGVVAAILQLDELLQEEVAVEHLAEAQGDRHLRIGLDRADAVDAGDRGHDDDVVALQERARRRVAHAVDLLVDGRLLLDIGVRARHVGLGLVVVVVGDEVLDRALGKEALHLAVELGRERLVGGEDEGRALQVLDHVRHAEGLARAGDAEQHLVLLALAQALREGCDRLGLVAGGLVVRADSERPRGLEALLLERRAGEALVGGEVGHGLIIWAGAGAKRGVPRDWRAAAALP